MMVGKRIWVIVVCMVCSTVSSFGAEEFEKALPGKTFAFPRDHFSHPQFRTEWWYYTGNITEQEERPFGYQLTFFRTGFKRRKPGLSKWSFDTLYFAHFALTDKARGSFFYSEKMSRGALGMAGAATDRLHVWIDDWSLTGDGPDHVIEAQDSTMAIRFRLKPLKPPVVNGVDGVSQKAKGQGYASYYYSMTRMETRGDLTFRGKKSAVDGLSWMDHEFGTTQLRDYQIGWDWFSLQLQNNTELMVYIIRHGDGTPDPYSSGTLIHPDGSSQHLTLDALSIEVLGTWKSRRTGGDYPAKWRIRIPESDIDLTVTPSVSDQELVTQQSTRVTYWEGSVTVTGSYGGKPVSGLGYVELTGYAEPLTGQL
jgi:predicted secreted hydrolase